MRAILHGAEVDTTGIMVLDTGAGYLGLDRPVAVRLGLAEEAPPRAGVGLASRPLARFEVGRLQIDYITPVLTIDGDVIRRVTDRPVLGLVGQRLFTGRAVIIDYRDEGVTILPVPQRRARSREESAVVMAPHFSERARVVPFTLAGDGKILVRATLSDPWADSMSAPLNLIVDTGATRCVLFEDALGGALRHHGEWRSMVGLSAPTLFGDEPARVSLVPRFALEAADSILIEDDIETVIIGGPLAAALATAVGEPVHGLIGYTLLSRYRVGIDYVNRMLWLDPMPPGWENRPFRDSQIGIQVERRDGVIVISGVVRDSPAAEAGMRVGDEIALLAGTPSRSLDVARSMRRLEGPPGSTITLSTRRNGQMQTYKLLRRNLLGGL